MNTTASTRASANEETEYRFPSVPRSSRNSGTLAPGCPARVAVRAVIALLLEPVRELLDDPVGEDIGHGQDLGEDLIEGLNILVPFLLQPRDHLLLGEGEVQTQEIDHVLLGPVRIRPAQ